MVHHQNAPEPRRRLSILLADDDRDTVTTLAAILHDEGHIVHTVYRGDDVSRAVARYRPEVCILDIELPGRSGYSLARELAELASGDRPVLVAISGKYTRSSEQLLARAVGFDRFFIKPAEPSELLGFLDQIASTGNSAA